jgi:hypothetical protein
VLRKAGYERVASRPAALFVDSPQGVLVGRVEFFWQNWDLVSLEYGLEWTQNLRRWIEPG